LKSGAAPGKLNLVVDTHNSSHDDRRDISFDSFRSK
jgi:hypothetical protein